MSTRRPKLYSRADIDGAERSSQRVRRHYSRRSKRRETVQVRVSKKWHLKLRELAESENLVLSFLLDEICKHFFRNY